MASYGSTCSSDFEDCETSPLIDKRCKREESNNSSDSFHSCVLSPVTEARPSDASACKFNNAYEEHLVVDTAEKSSCLPRLKRNALVPFCCNGQHGWGFIASLSSIKPYLLVIIAATFSVMIAARDAKIGDKKSVSFSRESDMKFHVKDAGLLMDLTGPMYSSDANDLKSSHNITIFATCGRHMLKKKVTSFFLTASWQNGSASSVRREKFEFQDNKNKGSCVVHVTTSSNIVIPLTYTVVDLPEAAALQPWIALMILIMVYLLIILELTHRATAAMLGGLGTIAALTMLNKGPTIENVMEWIGKDVETLSLLFGMMIIVSVLAETGFFSIVALKAFKFSHGKTWWLITSLCIIAAVVSAFLDNVTTILLLTPVTIRLCEVSNLDAKYVLIAEVLFSNIGGTATAIGDPPNVLIVGNSALQHKGIAFGNLTLHLAVGIIVVAVFAYITLRILYRWKTLEKDDPPIIEELRREADIWQRTASRLCMGSPEEKTVKVLLLQKSMMIRNVVAKQVYRRPTDETCAELAKKYQITDVGLLAKTGLVVVVVIILFFIQILDQVHLKIGWIPLFGAIWLILLADIQQLERIIERVEWTTLIFFASLFVLMEGVSELGLIDVVGTAVQHGIQGVKEDKRLLVAIIAILWISALVSSFIDNIPFTSAMIPVILKLTDDPDLKLPVKPLVYALAFGACLGGNGTLVGASANLVAAGLSEQQGYKISFNAFFKVGFPVMLVSVFIASCFLLISHVALSWDCALSA